MLEVKTAEQSTCIQACIKQLSEAFGKPVDILVLDPEQQVYRVTWNLDCGRMGELIGSYFFHQDSLKVLESLKDYEQNFGEALGKHSDVHGVPDFSDPVKVYGVNLNSGYAHELGPELDIPEFFEEEEE